MMQDWLRKLRDKADGRDLGTLRPVERKLAPKAESLADAKPLRTCVADPKALAAIENVLGADRTSEAKAYKGKQWPLVPGRLKRP